MLPLQERKAVYVRPEQDHGRQDDTLRANCLEQEQSKAVFFPCRLPVDFKLAMREMESDKSCQLPFERFHINAQIDFLRET